MRRQRQKFLLLLLDRSHCPHFGPTIPALSFPKSLLLLLLERFGTQWFYFSLSLSSLSRAAKLLAVELNRTSELQRTEQTKEGRKEGRGRSRSRSSDSVSLPVQPLQQCFFLLRRFPSSASLLLLLPSQDLASVCRLCSSLDTGSFSSVGESESKRQQQQHKKY